MYAGNVGKYTGNPEENHLNFRKLEETTFNSIRNILPDRASVGGGYIQRKS